MLTEKPWKPEAVGFLVMGWIACMLIGVMLGEALWQWAPIQRGMDRSFFTVVMGSLSLHGAALAWAWWLVRHHDSSWDAAFGVKPRRVVGVMGLAVAVTVLAVPLARIMSFGIAEAMQWVGMEPESQATVKALESTVSTPQRIFFGLVAVGLAPVSEEVIFRGILYPAIKQMGFPLAALWGTSLVFGLLHANVLTFIPLVLLSVVWTLLYERTDTLIAPIVAHALFNAANFFSLLQLQSGVQG